MKLFFTTVGFLFFATQAFAVSYCVVYKVEKGIPAKAGKGFFDGKQTLELTTSDRSVVAQIRSVKELDGKTELSVKSNGNVAYSVFSPAQDEMRLGALFSSSQVEVICRQQ